MDEILTDLPADGILRITLNRPDALNSFTFAMYQTLLDRLEQVRHDGSVKAVLLTGAGRAFCAGHDIRGAGSPAWVPDGWGKAQTFRAIMARLGRIPVTLRSLPQPVICLVNGAAAGAGYPLALACDMVLAGKSAKFVNAFHNAGSGHEMGLSYLLPRLVGAQRAAELLLTGRAVLADEAERIGLVLHTVEDGALQAAGLELAARVAVNSPIGVSLTKQSLWLNSDAASLEAAIEMENRAIFMSQQTADSQEKRASFMEKRTPVFTQK